MLKTITDREIKKLKTNAAKYKCILLIAIIFSAAVFIASPINKPINDSAVYADIAKNIVVKNTFTSNIDVVKFNAMGFTLILGVFLFLFGLAFFIKFFLAALAFFLVIAVFWTTKEITGNDLVAKLTILILVLLPIIVYNSLVLLADVTFLLFITLSLLFYTKMLREKTYKLTILWSFFVIYATLIKHIGYLMIIIYILHFLLQKFKKTDISFNHLLLFLIISALVFIPWTYLRSIEGPVRELTTADRFIGETNVGHLVFTLEGFNKDTGKPLNANAINVNTFVPVQVVNFSRILLSAMLFLTPIVMLTFLYRLFLYFTKRKRKSYDEMLFLIFFGFLVFHSLYPGSFESRYVIPMALPAVIFFSEFVTENYKRRKQIITLLVILQILISIGIIYWDSKNRWSRLQTDLFEDTGLWLKQNTLFNHKILAYGYPSSSISYYSDRKFIYPDSEVTPDILIFSDFHSSSVEAEEILKEFGFDNIPEKTFNDGKYFVNIHSKEPLQGHVS